MSCCDCYCDACEAAHAEERAAEAEERRLSAEESLAEAWTPARSRLEQWDRDMRRQMVKALMSPVVDPNIPHGTAFLICGLDKQLEGP